MSDYETEIGRGRQHDSSSDGESSPGPARKKMRPAIPNSDDEDASMSPVEGDDTPPPTNRPIIRQALGFSSAFAAAPSAQSITTYEAQIPRTTSGIFLPGQAPVKPPPPPKPKKPRKKKNDEFLANSHRFRIENYGAPLVNPIPIQAPVIPSQPPPPQDSGPYGSLYRVPDPRRSQSTNESGVSSGTLTDGSSRGQGRSRSRKTVSTDTQKKKTHRSSQLSHVVRSPHPDTGARSQLRFPPASSPRTPYYREHYQAPNERRRNAEAGPSNTRGYDSLLDDHDSEDDVQSQDRRAAKSVSRRRQVSILVHDMRGGFEDNQVVDVYDVEVRPAQTRRVVGQPVEKGFWTDSKELLGKWQSTLVRVDGPAQVYTLRNQNGNQFRQILMKVTEDNKDEIVTAELTLRDGASLEIDVVIENLPLPGQPPQRPHIPPSLRIKKPKVPQLPMDTRHSNSSTSTVSGVGGRFTRSPSPRVSSTDRRRSPIQRPSSVISVDGPSEEPNYLAKPADKAVIARDFNPDIGRVEDRGYESPESDADSEAIDEAVQNAVRQIIQEREGWIGFFRRKASPQTASNMLEQYRFLYSIMEDIVGQPAPFQSIKSILIEERHVIKALLLEDEDGKLASNIRETIDLIDLYGREGTRLQHPEVIKLLDDNTPPINYAKPIKRLLHLLREVDEGWKTEHPKGKKPQPRPLREEYSDYDSA